MLARRQSQLSACRPGKLLVDRPVCSLKQGGTGGGDSPPKSPFALAQLREDFASLDLIGFSNALVYKAVKCSTNASEACVFAAKLYSNDGVDPCKLECDLLRRLDHPCIPKVYEFYAGERESAFVMDFAPGRSLAALSEEAAALPLADVLHIAERVFSALAYVHGRGVCHNDVACDNIIYHPPTGQVWLIDWNNSHRADSCDPYGKPAYRNNGEAGSTAEQDVYALGVVLQRALARVDAPPLVRAWLQTLLASAPERPTALQALAALGLVVARPLGAPAASRAA